jgi:SOS-response transcriptional repressor LexA
MDLYEVSSGAIGKIYWYANIHRELAEKEIEKIRQQSISNTLNSTLTNMMYEPGKAINSLDGVIQRGWDDAKRQIEMLENGIAIKWEYVQIGDTTKEHIGAIERSEGFREWLNPYLIDEIKSFQNA